MKLPESKRERLKILALIVIGGGLVIFGLIVGVINPYRTTQRSRVDSIEKLTADLSKAKIEIRQMGANLEVSTNLVNEIRSSNRHILHSRLGNYELSASEALDMYARRARVGIDSITEAGIVVIPETAGRVHDNAIKAYSVNVRLECGFHQLVDLLEEIEGSNPYLCVSRLEIQAQEGKPGVHAINLTLQWPIWGEAEEVPKLMAELRDGADVLSLPGDQAPAAISPASAVPEVDEPSDPEGA